MSPASKDMDDAARPEQRILIVRLSAIGDVIHTLPALEALRSARPDAEIGWITEPPTSLFLDGHPALDRVHVYPRKQWQREGWTTFLRRSWQFFRTIRSLRYDVAVDLQGNSRSGLAAFFSCARRRVGFAGPESRELNRIFMTERHTPPSEAVHVVDKNVALMSALGAILHSPGEAPAWRFPAFPQLPPDLLHEDGRRPRIALNPGAGWAAKRWPAASFGLLAARLKREYSGGHVFVTLGPREDDLGAGVETGIREADADPAEVLTPLPALDLLQLGSFLRSCDLLVSGDTAALHLAAALGVPVVALFAEVSPARNGPYGTQAEVIDRTGEGSARRAWQTRRRSAGGEGYPIESITPDEVFERCARILGTHGT